MNSKIIKLAGEISRSMNSKEIDKALETETNFERRAALRIAQQADNTCNVEMVASWYTKDDKFDADTAEEIRKSIEYIKKRLAKTKDEEFALIRNDNLSQAEQELKILFSMIEDGYIIPDLLAQEA